MRALLIAGAGCLLLWSSHDTVRAQPSAPPRMLMQADWAASVETSNLETALQLFADDFWDANPAIARPNDNQAIVQADIADASRGSYQRLAESARRQCARLSERQRNFLRRYTSERFEVVRQTTYAALDSGQAQRLMGVTLQFREECEPAATASANLVNLDDSLVLSALFAALYQATQYQSAPERMGDALAAERARYSSRPWVPEEAPPLVRRIDRTEVWRHTLRTFRSQIALPLPLSVYDQWLFAGSNCEDPIECELNVKLGFSYIAATKFELYFREQLDFLIAHELSHHALDHDPDAAVRQARSQGQSPCSVIESFERDADALASRIARSPHSPQNTNGIARDVRGLFVETLNSGVELFMVDTVRIAGVSEAAECGYPSFRDRLSALGLGPPRVDFTPILGVWEGQFSCSPQNNGGLRVTLQANAGSELTARVDVYPQADPSNISAAATMAARYEPSSRTLALSNPTAIQQPRGFRMPNLSGTFTGASGFRGEMVAAGRCAVELARVDR